MALRFDSNGWLVPGSDPAITVDTSHRIDRSIPGSRADKTSDWSKLTGGSPLGVVWHWTGGARSVWSWLMNEVKDPSRRASWHFSIKRDGTIAQHAPLTRATWHAGCDPSKASCGTVLAYPNNRALPPIPTRSANSFFLGVELENAGILRQQNGKWYAWPYAASLMTCSGTSQCSEKSALATGGVQFESNYIMPDSKVFRMGDKAYESYTTSQVKAATELSKALKDALGWTRPEQLHYGHSQFIDQKLDPGDLWMDNILPGIERQVFGSTSAGPGAGTAWSAGIVLALAGGGYFLWRRFKGGGNTRSSAQSRLPMQPQLAAPQLDGTVGGTMSILSGILNGGFFTGQRGLPAGFGNLGELPPIDGSHSPFKRNPELIGTGMDPDGEVHDDIKVTDSPRERKQAEKWECEWQPVGTGRPDGSGTLAKSKVSEYMSEQLCTPIGDEVARHKPGYTKVVRIRKKTKQKYNKGYKKLLKLEKAEKKYENRNHPQKQQENYKKRKTGWPKFENNPTFAARMKRLENKAAKEKAQAAEVEAAKATKKAAAEKKAAAAEAKAEAAPKTAKQAKQAKGKKAANA